MTDIIDQSIRDHIIAHRQGFLIVDAGAGSGKTHTIVQRTVAMIAQGVDPRRIAAITFTNAAADEVRSRIKSALVAAGIDSSELPTVSTIHSFAGEMLRRHGSEIGFAAGFEVISDPQHNNDLSRIVNQQLRKFFSAPETRDCAMYMLASAVTSDQIKKFCLSVAHQWEHLAPDAYLDNVARRALIDRSWQRLQARPRDESFDGALTILIEVDQLAQKYADANDGLRLKAEEHLAILQPLIRDPNWTTSQILSRLTDFGDPAKAVGFGSDAGWRDKMVKPAKEHFGLYREAIQRIAQSIGAQVSAILVDLSTVCALSALQERAAESLLSNQDVLVVTARGLHNSEEFARRVASQYDHVIVDEFQDTDPWQYDILDSIRTTWQTLAQSARSMLLVGDPKQSIYRFRGADLSLFFEATSTADAAVSQLVSNFRSTPKMLASINALSTPLLAEASEPISYTPMVAGSDVETAETPTLVRVTYDVEAVNDKALSQTAAIVETIGQLVADGHRPGDIAVLTRTRALFGRLAQQLAQAGIATETTGSGNARELPTIRDTTRTLRAIAQPGDRRWIADALMVPTHGLSETQLVSQRLKGFDFRVLGERGKTDDPALAAATATLADWITRSAQLTPLELVAEITQFLLNAQPDAYSFGDAAWLMDKIGQWQRAGAVHVGQIVELLDGVDSGRDFDQTEPTLDDNAVKIMTLHGAKGLEFKTVILAGIETTNNKSPSVLWAPAGDSTFYPEFGLSKLGHRKISSDTRLELAAQDKEADRDEERRLLYVALTRAIETVIVVAPATRPKKTATMGATIEPLLDQHGVQDFLPWPATKGDSGQSEPIRIAPDRDIIQQLVAHHAKLRSTTATQLRVVRDDDQPVSYATAKHDDDVPTGTGYGTIVHAILATASNADSRDRLTHLARLAEGDSGVILSDQWRDAAVDSVQLAFKQSDVLRRAFNAAESWRELPFTVAINDVIVDGVIDLLYLNDDGQAVIVDFKTDVAFDDGALSMYQRQLAIYAIGIEAALGIETVDTVLVQVRPDNVTDHRLGPLTDVRLTLNQELRRVRN